MQSELPARAPKVGTISTSSALFGDYCISMQASGEEVATWQSRMALAVTIPRIVAPLIGPMLATNMDESMRIVTLGTLLVTPAVLLLHVPREKDQLRRGSTGAESGPEMLRALRPRNRH